jgi:tripartite-type tricarboxylate transporter receptor subunit TctC
MIAKLLSLASLALLPALAAAQSWPVKPLRFICAQAPGVPNDLALRWTAERLTSKLGRPVVVENVLGAGGLIAAQQASKAAPDGYTFLMAGIGNIATDRFMYKSLPYDPQKDFTPVGMIFDTLGFLVAVHPDLPVKNIPELIAYAKANPGKISYGSDTIGTTGLIGPWFNKRAGTDMVAVSYKNPGQLVQDIVAGRTQLVFYSIALLKPYRESGKVRALAVTSEKRYPTMPDLPTVGETIPGYRIGGMGMMVAPTGTSADIVQRLNREIDPITRDPEYRGRLANFGFDNSDGARTLAGLEEVIRNEREYWGNLLRELNFEPQ